MERILLLEDDIALGQGIAMALQIPNIEIAVCRTLGEARRALAETAFVLLILDVNLPDGSGLDLLREQKALRPELPVILLTANDLELDEVAGLESGADDYITKPFSLAVLRARVNARLRRPGAARRGELALPPFVFDFERMVYRKHGAAIELSRTEQRLLRALVENRGRAVSRAALVDRVWTDGGEYVDENALTVTVRRLRAKLEDDPRIAQSGLRRFIGMPAELPFNKSHVEIGYADAQYARWMFCDPAAGRLPREGTSEAATDTEVLRLLGVEPVLGAEFTVTFPVDGHETTQTFTLSGWWERDEAVIASHILIPESRVNEILREVGVTPPGSDGMTGTWNLDVMLKSGARHIRADLDAILRDRGCQSGDRTAEGYVDVGVN